MKTLKQLLQARKVLVLDGGFATELEKYGADLNHELWSARVLVEQPELIRRVHLDYLRAGADLILSGSYQASIEGFLRYGLSGEAAAELLRKSVTLALEARDEFLQQSPATASPLVGASIGPYGAYLANGAEYTGVYEVDYRELHRFHRERLEHFLAAKPDFIAFETTPNLMETRVYLDLLETLADTPAMLSFSCASATTLASGEQLSEAVALADKAEQVQAIGLNCCAPELVSGALKTIAAYTEKPLLVYPNSGENWDSEHKCWIAQGKEVNLTDAALQWVQEGVSVIGGCCRTNPLYIKQIVGKLQQSGLK